MSRALPPGQAGGAREGPGRVGLEPARRVLPGFLRILAPWSVVVVGRRVCLVAQRVPALVRLVRGVAGVREARRRNPRSGDRGLRRAG